MSHVCILSHTNLIILCILSYAIGCTEPLAIYIKTNEGDIEVPKNLYEECKPLNIINDLNLKNICYEELARFGHFTN